VLRELGHWLRELRRLVPTEDLEVLLSPPQLVLRFSKYALARVRHRASQAPACDLEARDPELLSLGLELCRFFGEHYFRLRIEGAEHVPREGPVLLVGNHNGAFLPNDGFFTSLALRDTQGPSRRMYALVHDFLLEDPLLRRYALRLGMLRATPENARRALAAGHCVLVYPGSDYDAFRPFGQRSKIVLGGRKGFLKIALEMGVPIVPVVSAGTHEQLIVLMRGDRLAKVLHAHAWLRSEVLPIVLSVPWGITSGFLPYLPLPAQTSLAFGAPIEWPELGPEDAARPEVLEGCYRRVEREMQELLDRLSEGRRFLLGKPH
jgi:1-acyl-sn-glycerol-3-phosphate acyltransferase